MDLKGFSLYGSIIGLAFIVGNSDGLKCYNCQAPIPESGEDPCRHAKLETCPPSSSQCLSAKFSVSTEPLKNEKEVISALTCFPDMNGDECDFFLEKVQQATPSMFKVKFYEECKVCPTDGCNSAPGKTLSTFLVVGMVIFIFFAPLLKFY